MEGITTCAVHWCTIAPDAMEGCEVGAVTRPIFVSQKSNLNFSLRYINADYQ